MRKTVCETLRHLRKNKGLKQEDVAAALNMSQNAYSLLESGKTRIDLERLYQIANFYKLSIYDILKEDLSSTRE